MLVNEYVNLNKQNSNSYLEKYFKTETLQRLKGKGFKSIRGNGVGDQMVKILVKTPTRLSRDERELYEKLREADKKSNNETIFEKFKKAFKK